MMEGIRLLQRYEEEANKSIKIMEEKELEAQRKVDDILDRISSGFEYLTSQV